MTNSTVAAFNLFDEAWVLAGSSLDTRPILIQIYLETFQNLHFSYGMALSLVVTVGLAAGLAGLCRARLPQHAVRLMQAGPAFRILIWLGVAVLLLWSLGPIYWTLASSITPSADFSARPIHFFPQNFTLDHYERLLGINVDRIGGVQVWAQFRAALFNSVITSLACHDASASRSRRSAAMPSRGSISPAGRRCSSPSSRRWRSPAMPC